MHFNYKVISKLLQDANMTWAQALSKSWTDTDDNGQQVTVKATMSGILAAAHLRGAWGTAELLTKDKITCDEQGTCITKYVHKFGGYNTLFDVPGDSVTQGSPYDEVLMAGWGNDTVILGGAKTSCYSMSRKALSPRLPTLLSARIRSCYVAGLANYLWRPWWSLKGKMALKSMFLGKKLF
ncbi:hypothetical protein CF140_12865 [Aeromonas sobria]|nr:hypothetical protein CF140_12865 [Aeromonas sobria]